MTDDIRDLHNEIKALYERIIELEREVASLRAATARQPVYAPQPVAPDWPPLGPYWSVTGDSTEDASWISAVDGKRLPALY